jgi:predicted O-methyltransferase YrrM
VIYEALMMGRKVIYFNPHGEPFRIFQQDETGAVPVARNQSELLALLRLALATRDDDGIKRRQFLLSHCATLEGDAAARCAETVRAIAERHAGGVSSNQVRNGTQHQPKEYRLHRVGDQLLDCSKAELIERAKVHLQCGRIADAADCIRLGRERYPNSSGFEAAWNQLQSALGGQIPEHRSPSAAKPALPSGISAADVLNHPSVQNACALVEQIDRKITGRIFQNDHIHYLYVLKKLMGSQFRNYLEIGVLHGGTMALMMQGQYGGQFVGIDTFNYYDSDIDPGSGLRVDLETAQENVRLLNSFGYSFKLVQGNSHDPAICEHVRSNLEFVDILLLDGDHSASGVTKDFQMYSDLVRPGGFLAIDDYDSCWKEVKPAVNSLDKSGWHFVGAIGHPGIGYLYILQRE